jgi:hypothetical protein
MSHKTSSDLFDRILQTIYALLLCSAFAVILVAQVLGFARVYQPLIAVVLTLVIGVVAVFWYGRQALVSGVEPPSSARQRRMGVAVMLGCGAALLLILWPRFAGFPASNLMNSIADDFFQYHAVKAIELLRSGHFWDLSILYGDYPNGYEALLTFALALGLPISSIGWIHGLIALWLWVTLVLLLRSLGSLPLPLSSAGALGLLMLPFVYSPLMIVGKNDVFIATAACGGILHALAPRGELYRPVHLAGLAMCTLIAAASKANGALILAALWLWVVLRQISAWRQTRAGVSWRLYALCVGIMLPAGLWLVRNVSIMGTYASPEVASFSSTSLLANLADPRIYQSGGESALLLLLAGATLALLGLIRWRLQRWGGYAFVVVAGWLVFAATPLSAFHTPQREVLHLEWRYALHLWLMLLIGLVALAAPALSLIWQRLANWRLSEFAVYGCVLAVLAGVYGFNERTGASQPRLEQAQRFSQPANVRGGTGGYAHVYDYVQRNLRGVRIWYDIAQHYYLYDPAYTNQPNAGYKYPLGLPQVQPYFVPDYAVISTAKGLADEQLRLGTTYSWDVLYDDGMFQVLRRRA